MTDRVEMGKIHREAKHASKSTETGGRAIPTLEGRHWESGLGSRRLGGRKSDGGLPP